MSRILSSKFVRIFAPTALVLFPVSGVSMLALIVSSGMTFFGPADPKIESRLLLISVSVSLIGVLFYLWVQRKEIRSWKKLLLFILSFGAGCFLVTTLSPIIFIAYSFYKDRLLFDLYNLIFGKNLTSPSPNFENSVFLLTLSLAAIFSLLIFLSYKKSGNSLKESFLSALTFFWLLCLPIIPLFGSNIYGQLPKLF